MSSPIPDKRRAYQLGLRFGGRFGFCRQTANALDRLTPATKKPASATRSLKEIKPLPRSWLAKGVTFQGLYFGDVFKRYRESGMVVPFVACAISPNSSVIALRMERKSDAQVLAEHTEGAGFRLPMTIVVVDRKNESAKITIDTTGKMTRH